MRLRAPIVVFRSIHHARTDRCAGANFTFGPITAPGPTSTLVSSRRAVDYRGRMDSPRYRTCSLTSIADNSASAANSSPTRATACHSPQRPMKFQDFNFHPQLIAG